jgi:hypothetical protein
MSQTITIELNDDTYASLVRQAEFAGQTPAERLRAIAEREAGSTNGTTKLSPPSSNEELRARIERVYPGVLGPPDTRTEEEKRAATEAFNRLIGSVRSGRPTGADNEQIDADLAREYGDNHEDD